MLSSTEEKEFINLYRKGYLPGKKSLSMTHANLEFLRKDKELNPHHEKKIKNNVVKSVQNTKNTKKTPVGG